MKEGPLEQKVSKVTGLAGNVHRNAYIYSCVPSGMVKVAKAISKIWDYSEK